MTKLARIGLFAQVFFYILAGLNHFWHPDFYLRIMPDHYSNPRMLVGLSGVAEILGGLGLVIPATRKLASLGLAAMLIVFLDVHVYMLRHSERFPGIPLWILWARLPLQAILIAWALYYAKQSSPDKPAR